MFRNFYTSFYLKFLTPLFIFVACTKSQRQLLSQELALLFASVIIPRYKIFGFFKLYVVILFKFIGCCVKIMHINTNERQKEIRCQQIFITCAIVWELNFFIHIRFHSLEI